MLGHWWPGVGEPARELITKHEVEQTPRSVRSTYLIYKKKRRKKRVARDLALDMRIRYEHPCLGTLDSSFFFSDFKGCIFMNGTMIGFLSGSIICATYQLCCLPKAGKENEPHAAQDWRRKVNDSGQVPTSSAVVHSRYPRWVSRSGLGRALANGVRVITLLLSFAEGRE